MKTRPAGYGKGERHQLADEWFDLGPLTPAERSAFLSSIAGEMHRAELRRQPKESPQQKLDV